MSSDGDKSSNDSIKLLAQNARQVLKEPILKILLRESNITATQLETLLIDLVIEDSVGSHISYDEKASLRSRGQKSRKGVSRGAFNRTLRQARKNVTKCIYTMLLLAYLGLFDISIFRPFEEVAGKIGSYRTIREMLSDKDDLSSEDIESYRASEKVIQEAIQELLSPLSLKSDLSRKRKE
ncbi:MAG: hypothetical protein BAJATHORv1_20432 [Candidatus Thorarchaeota archaeon]|nr:MAG: hypothetical protein BAJATHORv1_20432 [Candidatus Thorarchaeota archaeon]